MPRISPGALVTAAHRKALIAVAQGAGDILLKSFGKVRRIRQKGEAASVVCEADLAAEKYVFKKLRSAFPDHGFIGEEGAAVSGSSGLTWVVDPLDGTSNFVAGLPWFGSQIGLLHGNVPVLAAMCLPVEPALYVAEAGKGVWRNGKKLQVTSERMLRKTLCAFGFDPGASPAEKTAIAARLMRVAGAVRNIRATNSLLDFCFTMEGKLGGCINLNCKIWDIVPAALMIPEAGGIFTGLDGRPIDFSAGQRDSSHTFAVIGASRRLYPRLFEAVSRAA
jgi:myo-inositol-1(or 4)-monophosphatase